MSPKPDTYSIAQSLASDLAENQTAAEIASCFIENAAEKAKEVRARSDGQGIWFGHQTNEDEYHFNQRAIYGAIYSLLEGYKSYRLIKEDNKDSLDSRESMLYTLHLAYQFALEQYSCVESLNTKRLTTDQERDLGRRLAEYWGIKE